MTSMFTRGPWKAGSEVAAQRGIYTANIELGGTGRLALVNIYSGAEGECEANARLIAAAPDLYAALCDFVAGADAGHVSLEVDKAARAALAKARGEQP